MRWNRENLLHVLQLYQDYKICWFRGKFNFKMFLDLFTVCCFTFFCNLNIYIYMFKTRKAENNRNI